MIQRLLVSLVAVVSVAFAAPAVAAAAPPTGVTGMALDGRAEISWLPVAGASSYEVLVRRTTAPTWERVMPVGAVTSFTLGFQLDDGWAAVRAVGPSGHRSLARAASPPPRPRPR